jgi:GNAT superfamily N-acetyltransferase
LEDGQAGLSVTELRRAVPEEADALSALAVRSKAHWGYDAEFLDACRDELTLTPAFVRDEEVYVLLAGGALVGFYSLARWKADIELCHLFVDSSEIGKGAGRLLWEDAVWRAEEMGYDRLLVQSDPFAEGFYLKLGADRIGEVPSQALPGRSLPLLVYPLREP